MSNVVLTSVHDNLVNYVLAHGLNPNVVVPLIDQAAAEAIAGWRVTGVVVSTTAEAPFDEAQTIQFAAEVQGTGEYTQNVTWSISGNEVVATTISSTGLLTLAAGEFLTGETPVVEHDITVTATSVDNEAISGSVSFTCVTGYYSVLYDANGGTGVITDEGNPYNADDEVIVAANTFTPPTNAIFVEWNTAADGSGDDYNPDDVFEIDGSITLYAIWRYAVVEEPFATDTYLYVEPFSSEDATFLSNLGEDDFVTLNFVEWEVGVGAVSDGASFSLELAYPVLAGLYVINEPLTTGDSFSVSLPTKFTNTTFPIRNVPSLILPDTMNVGFFTVTPI